MIASSRKSASFRFCSAASGCFSSRDCQNRLNEAEEERRSLEAQVERLGDARELKKKCDDVKSEVRNSIEPGEVKSWTNGC